jgi:hypothetical protein
MQPNTQDGDTKVKFMLKISEKFLEDLKLTEKLDPDTDPEKVIPDP